MNESSEEIPLSRKRHHSRSRSRSKSPSTKKDEQELKRKKIDKDEIITEQFAANDNSKEKENHGNGTGDGTEVKMETSEGKDMLENKQNNVKSCEGKSSKTENNANEESNSETPSDDESKNSDSGKDETQLDDSIALSSDSEISPSNQEAPITKTESNTPTKKLKQDTPNKKLTPKQLQKKLEIEKKQQERQKEKEERMRKKLEEKLKKKELKDKELEQKKKEKEEKEEKKRKEREEREQKRKEKEEKEEQKRKEREEEKQKKLLEIEEKNKEKLKEEEKKQKAAAAFVNFFVPKKPEDTQDDRKIQSSNFLQFEVKSDMKLPPARRDFLSQEEKEQLETFIKNQNKNASYLKDLSSGKPIRKSLKTWPYEEAGDDDVVVVDLGETIFEDKESVQKYKAKFLYFHENRRPAYYGTWRKKSKSIKPRKPLVEDSDLLNYEEDSDDDWEEEEQGESLNGSEDEADKDNDDEKDDYEVDNDFFVPHGHLSEDEVDDEDMTRLSPESLKQKLKLLKEEFDQDMKSKTHKLKPRSIGCIWYNKDGSNVEEAVDKYLQPLSIIAQGPIIIKNREDILFFKEKKNKVSKELDPELFPLFLKIVHGNTNKKSIIVEQFLTDIEREKTGSANNVSKNMLVKVLKDCANWEKYRDKQGKRYKFRWSVHQNIREKYNLEELAVDNNKSGTL